MPLPFRVREWLIAEFLKDPTPASWQREPDIEPERVVMVPEGVFFAFLRAEGIPLMPTLDNWKNEGWIDDVLIEIELSTEPAPWSDLIAYTASRLGLGLGRHRLLGIRPSVLTAPVTDANGVQYVTLSEATAVARVSKRTGDRWFREGKLPPPDVKGGNGKPHKWLWSNIRRALEKETGHTLPAQHPNRRI